LPDYEKQISKGYTGSNPVLTTRTLQLKVDNTYKGIEDLSRSPEVRIVENHYQVVVFIGDVIIDIVKGYQWGSDWTIENIPYLNWVKCS
jgi:hypothetical protein